MNQIEQIREQRRLAHEELLRVSPRVYPAFLAMEAAAFADGALPRVEKELIAVGISIVIDCASCLEWHITHASRLGATRAQLVEAIEVGIEMGGGPATVSARFALEVINQVLGGTQQLPRQQT